MYQHRPGRPGKTLNTTGFEEESVVIVLGNQVRPGNEFLWSLCILAAHSRPSSKAGISKRCP